MRTMEKREGRRQHEDTHPRLSVQEGLAVAASGGSWTKSGSGAKAKMVFMPLGQAKGPSDVEWAAGVKAIKSLGGQVPQKAVNQAEKLLQKAGKSPAIRQAPKTYTDVAKFYEKTRPVVGDVWKGKGITVEVTKLAKNLAGGTGIDLWITTKKEGRMRTIYTAKDWS